MLHYDGNAKKNVWNGEKNMSRFQLQRCSANPILKPNPSNVWEEKVVLNPAAYYEDGTFYLYYRAAGNDKEHKIYIGLATSKDGIHFERTSDNPVLSPQELGFDAGCVEDPRIVEIEGVRYMTYAYRPFPPGQYWIKHADPVEDYGVSPNAPRALVENITSTALAILDEKTGIKRLGRITLSDVDDRDVILFSEKIQGKYCRLSRPIEWAGKDYPCENPAIWINFSDSLMDWDENETKLLFQGQSWWESKKIGAGTPPIKTDKGWLLIYHGVDDEGIYRVGAAMLDLNDPTKVIARTEDYIFEPETDYEKSGVYNGCVFPTGTVVVDGELYVYYGCADQFCCLATCKLNELVDYVMS